jgi:hypothetical protein
MIKLIVTILFKSSAAIKIIFISLLHEGRFLFKGLSEIIVSGFDSINYHIFQPIRLIRFQDVRDFLSDHTQSIVVISFMIIIIGILSYKNVDSNNLKEDN